jgi:hypothetical protein
MRTMRTMRAKRSRMCEEEGQERSTAPPSRHLPRRAKEAEKMTEVPTLKVPLEPARAFPRLRFIPFVNTASVILY